MKPSFVPYLVAVAGSFCLMTALAAQEASPNHGLTEGAWALQFGIGQDLSLRDFQGAVISAKHHTAAARAIRYGLSAYAAQTHGDSQSSDQTQVSVGLVAHFLRYPTLAHDPAGNLQMFWGLGPRIDLTYHRYSPSTITVNARSVSVGAGATIGAEWFVRPRISLSAEYETTLMAEFTSDPAPVDWAVRLGPRGVLFGVSAYYF